MAQLLGQCVVTVTVSSGVGVVSISGDGDDTDVQEVVRVAEVFAEPLQRSLQQRLDTVNHNLVTPCFPCEEKRDIVVSML